MGDACAPERGEPRVLLVETFTKIRRLACVLVWTGGDDPALTIIIPEPGRHSTTLLQPNDYPQQRTTSALSSSQQARWNGNHPSTNVSHDLVILEGPEYVASVTDEVHFTVCRTVLKFPSRMQLDTADVADVLSYELL